LHGRNAFNGSPNLPADVLKALNDARVRGEERKSVAFSASAASIVISGRNSVFLSGPVPDTARSQLSIYRKGNENIKSFSFTPGGGWTILVNDTGAWLGPNIKAGREVLAAVTDFSHGRFLCLNFGVPKAR
jgi:hypothetical protein